MAVKERSGDFYLYFRPFKNKQIGLKLDVTTRTEAKQLEAILTRACRTGNYSALDATAREACVRMFQNQGWELPMDLGDGLSKPKDELSLWKACELFLKYPEIRACSERPRYEMCFIHLAEHFGKQRPVRDIWIPQVKLYMTERLNAGASASTVNREKGTLSKIFQVLIELQLIEVNPCRLAKNLSQKSEERQAYLSQGDVRLIADHCPKWFRPIIWTAYYTGMRRGEILGLARKQVNLAKRLITLSPGETKEAHWKRVPIHRDLIPILEEAQKVTCLGTEKYFVLKDGPSIRPLGLEAFKNPWPRACEALEEKELLQKPFPRFHDLRHTWKANARRSGTDPEVREAILGHAERGKSVVERYGRISDQELLKAIDGMTFDNGETEILLAGRKQEVSDKKCEHFVNKRGVQKKKAASSHSLTL
jgi:integrase